MLTAIHCLLTYYTYYRSALLSVAALQCMAPVGLEHFKSVDVQKAENSDALRPRPRHVGS